MALIIKALSRFVTSDRGGTGQANSYTYSTTDASATVSAAGYFDAAATPSNLKKGDRIFCSVNVEGPGPAPDVPTKLDLIITGISAAGVVTVA